MFCTRSGQKALTAIAMLAVLVPAAVAQQAAAPAPVITDAALASIEQWARNAEVDIARLRIDKWKTDGSNKQQAQATADSISRNLRAGLPEVVQKARTAPADIGAQFQLYRNVTLLYEFLST